MACAGLGRQQRVDTDHDAGRFQPEQLADHERLGQPRVALEAFGVLIIPHTWEVTTLSRLTAGDKVNLEADMMARYAARLMAARRDA